jgi:hypothetical protein
VTARWERRTSGVSSRFGLKGIDYPCGGHSVERVTGIGGMFFKARNPDGLNRWYAPTQSNA